MYRLNCELCVPLYHFSVICNSSTVIVAFYKYLHPCFQFTTTSPSTMTQNLIHLLWMPLNKKTASCRDISFNSMYQYTRYFFNSKLTWCHCAGSIPATDKQWGPRGSQSPALTGLSPAPGNTHRHNKKTKRYKFRDVCLLYLLKFSLDPTINKSNSHTVSVYKNPVSVSVAGL